MPKTKSKRPSTSTSDSDSGPDDRGPVKKSKPVEKPAAAEATKRTEGSGDGDELSWDLGKNRFVKLSEFKGKWYVNIREFYLANGDLRPGKKGIMLTMEQWQKFKAMIPDIDEAVKKNV